MRIDAGSSRQSVRGRNLVLLAGLVACALVLLEATEGRRTAFLPIGTADTAVDVALVWAICVIGGFGGADLLVQRRLRAGGADVSQEESEAIRTLYEAARRNLASQDPSVRLGALHDLEFLGQAAPTYRPAVVAHWCSYLRRAAGRPELVASSVDEISVRAAAQRLIGVHLREADHDGVFTTYWPEVREIDLEGAHLVRPDFRGCVVPDATFGGAVFHGDTTFDGAHFTGEAAFDEAVFLGSASFARGAFDRDAAFCATTFGDDAAFTGATFSYTALFVAAAFVGSVSFRGAEFRGELDFGRVRTGGSVDMTGSRTRSGYRHHLPQGWVADDDGTGWASVVLS